MFLNKYQYVMIDWIGLDWIGLDWIGLDLFECITQFYIF